VNPYILDPKEVAKLKEAVSNSRNMGLFTPPALVNTMQIPGNNGGANWGSTAVDPKRGWLYVASKELPAMLKLEEQKATGATFSVSDPPVQVGKAIYMANCQQCHKADLSGQMPEVPALAGAVSKLGPEQIKKVLHDGQGQMPSFARLSDLEVDRLLTFLRNPAAVDSNAAPLPAPARSGPAPPPTPSLTPGNPKRYWTGYNYMNASDGFPSIKPPFWVMSAYDLNEGKLKWQIPVGEVPALAARGIRNTGSAPTRGGPVATAGGLVFAPSQSDKSIYAYDSETGKTLWAGKVGAEPGGVPAIYEVRGQEYLVIAARDPDAPRLRPGQPPPTPPADPNKKIVQGYYVFALRD
jgi:quinoprotein glucose dehydrogenase